MVAYNFQPRFAEAVAEGRKRQTIRAVGKRRHARPGERVQLYTGMRTGACRKLRDPDPVCIRAVDVEITTEGVFVVLRVNGEPIRGQDARDFAQADGFECLSDMAAWFKATHGLPFKGVCIQWAPQKGQER